MTAQLPSMTDPRDARIAELEAQLTQRGELPGRVAALERENATLRGENARLQQENRALRDQLAQAERAAKRQATPFARRERQADPGKPGRKAGQGRFARRSIPKPEQVSETKTATLPVCPGCGGDLTERRTHEQFQIDIPPVTPIVTRFLTESGHCGTCGVRVQAAHPEQISTAHGAAGVVLGPRIKALAADLHHRFGASYGKLVELFRDAFGLETTRGGLSQADTRLAERAKPLYEELQAALRASGVVHADETGWRVGPLAAWLWVFCNEQITVYTIEHSRGHAVILEVLGRQFAGVLVCDCFVAYDAAALGAWLQQKCVAHLLRELGELTETKRGRARAFAVAVVGVLRDALALKAGAADLRTAEYEAAAAALEARLDRLLDERRHLRDADNVRLAKRLRKHRPDVLRFLYWEEVDATNNRAERQLRPAVITRKTGGCHRTEGGAAAHSILASLLATCRQQAVNILDYFIKLQQCGTPPPALVPALGASP